jgi:DNA-directed RNA polymerase specialized sigma24 family protein
MTDETLVRRTEEADALAFEVIFDRHGGAAFSLTYRMCGGQAMADDIVQETFLSLWRRRPVRPHQGKRAFMGIRRGAQQGGRRSSSG